MGLIRKQRTILRAIFILAVMLFPMHVYPENSPDVDTEDWAPIDTPKHYKSLDEERFSMECDYLGIAGERTGAARELFDTLLVARQRVDSERSRCVVTRNEAIELLNRIDLEYYLELKELVRGRRNIDRIGRLIVKVRARNGISGKLTAQAH